MEKKAGRPKCKVEKFNLNVRVAGETLRRLREIAETKGTTANQEALKMVLRGINQEFTMI